MADFILINGDVVNFQPNFGPAVVVVQPGTMQASGGATLTGQKLCIDGDEKNVSVPGCSYIAGAFATPGMGTLKIQALAPNQKATKTKSNDKPVLLKGGTFIAVFEVQSPAKMPPPAGTPDPLPQYPGSGSFVTTNTKFRGT
jgi:hypothetical protein